MAPQPTQSATFEAHIVELQLLEGRRAAVDAAMWQAPTIAFAGQAFLLQILVDKDIGWVLGTAIALVGVVASLGVGLVLFNLRVLEATLSERVTGVAKALGLDDPRVKGLGSDGSAAGDATWHPLNVGASGLAAVGMLLLAAVDVVALIVPRVS